jgi:hypothetical protein
MRPLHRDADGKRSGHVKQTSHEAGRFAMRYSVMKVKLVVAAVLAMVVLLMLSAIGGLARARGHSWYPPLCCNDKDCLVVDKVDSLPDGAELFHAGSITVIVPKLFKRMPSQDSHVHLCFYRVFTGEYRPRCVFVPGDS